MRDCLPILGQGDGRQDDDTRDHDHQLQQRDPAGVGCPNKWTRGHCERAFVSISWCLPLSGACRFATSHCTSPHSVPCPSPLSAHRIHFHHPTTSNRPRRNTNGNPIRLCLLSDRLVPPGDTPFYW